MGQTQRKKCTSQESQNGSFSHKKVFVYCTFVHCAVDIQNKSFYAFVTLKSIRWM